MRARPFSAFAFSATAAVSLVGCWGPVQQVIARTTAAPSQYRPAKLEGADTGSVVVLAPPRDGTLGPVYDRLQQRGEELLQGAGWLPVQPGPADLQGIEEAAATVARLGARYGVLVRSVTSDFGEVAFPWSRPAEYCSWRTYVPVKVRLDVALIDGAGTLRWSALAEASASDLLADAVHFNYDYAPFANTCEWDVPDAKPGELEKFCMVYTDGPSPGDALELCRGWQPPEPVLNALAGRALTQALEPLLDLPHGDLSVTPRAPEPRGMAMAAMPAPVPAPSAAAPAVLALKAPLKIAVLPLRALAGVDAAVTHLLTGLILSRLDEAPNATTVGEADMEAVLSLERQKDLLACDSTTCMAELAGALGADRVLHGEVGALGSRYAVNISVVRTADGTVMARVSRMPQPDPDSLAALVPSLVNELIEKLNKER